MEKRRLIDRIIRLNGSHFWELGKLAGLKKIIKGKEYLEKNEYYDELNNLVAEELFTKVGDNITVTSRYYYNDGTYDEIVDEKQNIPLDKYLYLSKVVREKSLSKLFAIFDGTQYDSIIQSFVKMNSGKIYKYIHFNSKTLKEYLNSNNVPQDINKPIDVEIGGYPVGTKIVDIIKDILFV